MRGRGQFGEALPIPRVGQVVTGLGGLERRIYQYLLESEEAKKGPRTFVEKWALRWRGR